MTTTPPCAGGQSYSQVLHATSRWIPSASPSSRQPKVPAIPKIAIEIDGVLANYMAAILGMAGEGSVRPWWEVETESPEDLSLLEAALQTEYFWMKIAPFDDIDLDYLRCRLCDLTASVHFICNRPSLRVLPSSPSCIAGDTHMQTIAWLQELGLQPYTAVASDVKSAAQYCDNHNITHLITDRPLDVIAALSNKTNALLLDRPWNRGYQTSGRVWSLEEAFSKIGAASPALLSAY